MLVMPGLVACATAATVPAETIDTAVVEQEAPDAAVDTTVAATVPTEPEPEPLIPVPEPATIVGYDEASLESLFGKPSFTRRDPPAEHWQYRNDHCTLDVFLYESAAGYSVEHVEFRETADSAEAIEHCLRAIIEQNMTETSAS